MLPRNYLLNRDPTLQIQNRPWKLVQNTVRSYDDFGDAGRENCSPAGTQELRELLKSSRRFIRLDGVAPFCNSSLQWIDVRIMYETRRLRLGPRRKPSCDYGLITGKGLAVDHPRVTVEINKSLP